MAPAPSQLAISKFYAKFELTFNDLCSLSLLLSLHIFTFNLYTICRILYFFMVFFFAKHFYAQDCSLIWLLVAIFWFSWFSASMFGFGFLVLVEGGTMRGKCAEHKVIKTFWLFLSAAHKSDILFYFILLYFSLWVNEPGLPASLPPNPVLLPLKLKLHLISHCRVVDSCCCSCCCSSRYWDEHKAKLWDTVQINWVKGRVGKGTLCFWHIMSYFFAR